MFFCDVGTEFLYLVSTILSLPRFKVPVICYYVYDTILANFAKYNLHVIDTEGRM